MPLYNKVIEDQEETESWMEKEDYNFLERAKAFGNAVTAQMNLTPNQTIQNFFGDGDIIEAYKNKTIGKEYIDKEIDKLTAAWNLLPDGGKRGIINTLQAGSEIAGNVWEDLKTVEGAERYDPIDWITSGLAHGIDFAGDKLDKYVAKPTAYAAHNWAGIDKRGADLTGLAAEMLLTRRAFKAIPQTIQLLNKGISSKQAHNLAFKAGQYVDEALGSFKPPSQRTITIKDYATILDQTWQMPSQEIQRIVKLAKQPGINSFTLAKRLNEQQGVIKEYLKKFGHKPVDLQGMEDKSKYQPPENFSGITPPTFDQSRQKINRAIGSDVYIRHADGVPRFDFIKLQNNKVFTSEYKRLIGSDISTIDEFGLPFAKRKRNVQFESRKSGYVNYRKESMDQYLEWYGPAMKRLGIKPSQIDLDHRLTLIQSLGIYHNVDPKSQLWIDIQNTAVRRGIYPGDAKRNLDLVDPESHRVKSNYFNDLHGLKTHNNMKYWNGLHRDSGKTRLQIMEESHLGPEYEKAHLEVVNDYFDVAERGNKILDSARAIWHAENMKGILPEEIVKTLMEVSIDPTYSPKQLKQIVDSMMDVEIEKYSKIQRLFEIELELEVIGSSPEIILDTDTQVIKDLKQEYKKLKTVRKSPWFKNHYNRMMKIRDAEIASPQRNIFEVLEFLFPE